MLRTANNLVDEMLVTGFSGISWPASDPFRENVPFLVSQFERLISRPRSYTDAWCIDREKDRPDYGLIRREGGVGHDVKWHIQYRSSLPGMLRDRGVDTLPFLPLLNGLEEFLRFGLRLAHDHLLESLQITCPEIDFERQISAGAEYPGNVLRLVRYEVAKDSQFADWHTDHSLFTFHLAESEPGLVLTADKAEWRSAASRIAVFPGKKAAILTRGKLKATSHAVINHCPDDPRHVRWALIFFLHSPEEIKDFRSAEWTR